MAQTLYQSDKGILLVKAESSYGVDASPTGANLILAEDIKFEPQGKTEERKSLIPVEGKLASKSIGQELKLAFKTELRIPDTHGNAPDIAPLLEAASLTEAIVGNVSYTASIIENLATPSVTIYFYNDGRLHKLVGGIVSSLKLSGKVQEKAMLEWEVRGIWADSHTSNASNPSLSSKPSLDPPAIFRGESVSFAGKALTIENATIDFGINAIARKDAAAASGIQRFAVASIVPKVTLDPEIEPTATWDPYALWLANTLGALVLTFHTANGLARFTIGKAEIQLPKEGSRDSIQTWGLDLIARAEDENTGISAILQYE